MRSQFQVDLFRNLDDEVPFMTVPIHAKMPLGAMVFAMQHAHQKKAGRVKVEWEEGEDVLQTSFYNVVIGRTQVKYDREKLPEV
jgi:hypothetical protein